jgi:hypothetical protein
MKIQGVMQHKERKGEEERAPRQIFRQGCQWLNWSSVVMTLQADGIVQEYTLCLHPFAKLMAKPSCDMRVCKIARECDTSTLNTTALASMYQSCVQREDTGLTDVCIFVLS